MSVSREPLADILLRTDVTHERYRLADLFQTAYLGQVKEKLRTARRMYFDPAASDAVCDLIVNHPREIIAALDDARPVLDSLWLEGLPVPDHWNGKMPSEYHNTSDQYGYLIENGLCHSVAWMPNLRWGKYRGSMHTAWERIQIDTSWSRDEQDALFESYKVDDWRSWIFGNLTDLPSWKDLADEELRMILDQTRVDLHGMSGEANSVLLDSDPPAMSKITLGGSLMIPIATMIMLNTPRTIREIPVPAYRRFFHGHNRQVREHAEIRLNISRDAVIHYVRKERPGANDPTPTGIHLREHTRRGHWCHDHNARNARCVHEWIADDPKHGHCPHCGGVRWWRDQYRAGDPKLGVIPPRPYHVTG